MHVITMDDLKEFQLLSYTELLKNPRSEKHKRFLKQQIKQLNGNGTENNNCVAGNNLYRERGLLGIPQ